MLNSTKVIGRGVTSNWRSICTLQWKGTSLFTHFRTIFQVKDRYISHIWIQSHNKMYTGDKNNDSEFRVVDLRSDTVTKPTNQMRQAMFEADVGDDVMREDPTINALEQKSASLLGKEAALFVPSGSMANLLAIMAHCNRRGCEIIVGDSTHIFKYEQGGSAQIAGVHVCTLANKLDGTFDLRELESHIRGIDDHEPETALVCVENSHNMCGGKVLPLEWLDKLAALTNTRGIPMHMDGARIFNASTYLKVPASRIVQDFASVSFCLSKGLGAPVGSLLVGGEEFIRCARRLRKALGGGMRQAGVLGAAGLVALNYSIDRLEEDHKNARRIAEAIAESKSKHVDVDLENLHTNILMVHVDTSKLKSFDLCERLSRVTEEEKQKLKGNTCVIKCFPKNEAYLRLVTHQCLSSEDIDAAVEKIKYVIKEYK